MKKNHNRCVCTDIYTCISVTITASSGWCWRDQTISKKFRAGRVYNERLKGERNQLQNAGMTFKLVWPTCTSVLFCVCPVLGGFHPRLPPPPRGGSVAAGWGRGRVGRLSRVKYVKSAYTVNKLSKRLLSLVETQLQPLSVNVYFTKVNLLYWFLLVNVFFFKVNIC